MISRIPDKIQFVLFFLLIFLSRLPFLFAEFGAEEDSWLLALTAKNIAISGEYEMSRAPAHPLQELIYSLLYHDGLSAFLTNLLSATGSVIAAMFFSLALKALGFRQYLFAGLAFAFAPVVYVSSTYTIDYMLAMAFIMAGFYFIVTKQEGLAGLMVGTAIGFRITSGAMVIPFAMILFSVSNQRWKSILIFSVITIMVGLITYIPVFKTYGFSFFTYADQFPYPPLAKVIYKATIGVFGLIGITAMTFYGIKIIHSKKTVIQNNMILSSKNLFWVCMMVLTLYAISYLRLPQKSAYLIPTVPFVIIVFGMLLSTRAFPVFCTLMMLSSFFFSINLTDSLRGAKYSAFALKFTIAGQEIFIDPLTGPIYSDYTKRLNKIRYAEEVYQKLCVQKEKMVLICGWWYNQLLVRNWDAVKNNNVELVFYISKEEIKKYLSEGYKIYYLPEQNLYNDLYSQMKFTDSAAKPFL